MTILKNIINIIISRLFLLISLVLSACVICANKTWTNLDFEQISANLNVTKLGFNYLIFSPTLPVYLLIATIIYLILIMLLSNRNLYKLSCIFFAIFIWQIKIIPFYYNNLITSDLYEKNYIVPQITSSNFPTQKRNLLIIYLESIEENFANPNIYQTNLLPNLSKLTPANPHFNNYYSLYGTHYTKGAFVAGICGIPNHFRPLDHYDSPDEYSNLTCISDILSQNGYETWFTQGTNHSFSGIDTFYKNHSYTHIITPKFMARDMSDTEIKEHHGGFGGLSDKILFKEIIQKFKTQEVQEPFLFTLFTIDSHTPVYIKVNDCKHKYDDIRDNILCTDNNVSNFLNEFKQTPYWKNTTIVILGDHLMTKPPHSVKNKKFNRSIYNVFLNLPHEFKYNSEKQFTAVDFAPTYLEAIGVNLPEHAFGLGRSLFSDVPTLISRPELNFAQKIKQKSKIYDNFHKKNK